MTTSARPGAGEARAPRLGPGLLALYGAPAFVLSLPTIPAYVLLPSFYAQTIGLGLSATGLALLLARLFDGLVDLPVGHLADRLAWRGLHYKPLIAIGALISAFALYQVFAPPDGAGPGYLLLWAGALYFGWTLIQLPYLAWGAALAPDYQSRARITGWREAIGLAGILAAAGVPAAIAWAGWEARTGFPIFALAVIALGAPAVLGLLLFVPEGRTIPILSRPAFRTLAQNGLFLRLLAAWFVNGLANGFPAALFPLFATYVLEATAIQTGLLLGVYFLAGVVFAPAWVALVRRADKHRLWCAAMLIACAAFAFVPLLGPGDMLAFMAICIVSGATLGADLALPPAIQADVIDWDRHRFSAERSGLLFGFWNMAAKFALALAVGIAFPLLAALGFETRPGNTAGALLALALIYSLIPVVLKLTTIALLHGFPMGRRAHRAVQRRLQRDRPEGSLPCV